MGTLAEGEGSDELGGVLPKAVAGAIIKEAGATQGTLHCRAHFLPQLETMGTPEAARAPTQNDVYEAQVFVSPGGVELLKKSTTLEVAPVEGKAKP
jgi:hypothetical protein